MSASFAEKLTLVLKGLSMTRADVAADLEIDKSAVARWLSGGARPSAHNLARLSSLLANRIGGFTTLDWDLEMEAFIELLGLRGRPARAPSGGNGHAGLRLPFFDQIAAVTSLRAGSYEGFYRTTRPNAGYPGQFLHDICLVRRGEDGLMRLRMASGGVFVDGWVLPIYNQLFIIASESNTGSLIFAILNGVGSVGVEVLDGLTLLPSFDAARTPTAARIVLHRIADLSADPAADDARFLILAEADPVAPAKSLPAALRRHLVREVDPDQATLVGHWVLRLPLTQSIASGTAPRLP